MSKKRAFLLIFFLITTVFSIGLTTNVWADETEEEGQEEISDLEEKIEEYKEKIEKLQGQANTLENEIAQFDSQINLTELQIQNSIYKIEKTQKEIQRLQEDIEDIGLRIDKLENSIDYQKDILSSRMRERYKNGPSSLLVFFFGESNFNKVIQKTEYLKVMELHDNKLLTEMEDTKTVYKNQKDIFQEKKDEEEQLKASLEAEKANLDSYKAEIVSKQDEKQRLLEATNNDESKYQELLDEAQRQLQSFKGFVDYAGGGIIGSNEFGSGDEGWYLSQRDSRWAYTTIGGSGYSIYEVGCLITSVSMVYNRYGYGVSPADIANDNSRFFSNTAMMLIPWQGPPGKSYHSISTSSSSIESELDKDRPVIVGVYAGPYGTHFVVLSEEDDGDYIMYDPYYGPDLDFSDYYSKSSIFQAVVFK